MASLLKTEKGLGHNILFLLHCLVLVLVLTIYFLFFCLLHNTCKLVQIKVSFDFSSSTEKPENNVPITGGAYDFKKATISLTQTLLSSPKKVTIVRHGLSSWNEENRVQVCCLGFFLYFFFS